MSGTPLWFAVALLVLSLVSGAAASVVGFGIGSLLTPLLATRIGTDVAVAAVTIPHAAATALRCWRLRGDIDWTVVRRFGTPSAIGALLGALLYARIGPTHLTRLLGALLMLTALTTLTGLARRWHPRGIAVGTFGLLSGFFGGVAGNQGGLRSAALVAFGLGPAAFIATATATGLLVDATRTPIYLWIAGPALLALLPWIGLATLGVLAGTLLGERILFGLSPQRFARVLALALLLLGFRLLTVSVT